MRAALIYAGAALLLAFHWILYVFGLFLLLTGIKMIHLLKYGPAAILMFIGVKMLLLDVYKIPVGIALGIVALILAASVAASLVVSRPGGGGAGKGR